jgi:hypothetical protein
MIITYSLKVQNLKVDAGNRNNLLQTPGKAKAKAVPGRLYK